MTEAHFVLVAFTAFVCVPTGMLIGAILVSSRRR